MMMMIMMMMMMMTMMSGGAGGCGGTQVPVVNTCKAHAKKKLHGNELHSTVLILCSTPSPEHCWLSQPPPARSCRMRRGCLTKFWRGKGRRFAVSGDESNLHVKNLPPSADELYMYKVFFPFGPLDSISVEVSLDSTWTIGFDKYQLASDAHRPSRA